MSRTPANTSTASRANAAARSAPYGSRLGGDGTAGYTAPVQTSEQMRQWVGGWATTGPALNRIRLDELRAMTPEAYRRAIAVALDLGVRFRVSRPTSGLVEQQRLFAKIRR